MAAAAAVQHALDTELEQCLVDFFDDASGLHWHHRLLLVEGETGQWIAATPDFDVELLDLSSHRVVPLTRRMVVPAAKAAESYMFDPLNDGEENTLLDQGRALARLLGFKVATAAATTGRLELADLGCGPRAFRAQGSARGAQSGGPRRDRDPRGSGPGAGRRSVGHDGESRRLEAGDLEGFEDDRVWTRPPGVAVAGRRHARRRQADLAHPGPGDPDLEEGVEANVFPSTGRSCWWSTSVVWRRAG